MKRIIILILFVTTVDFAFSQKCGTVVTQENLDFMNSFSRMRARPAINASVDVVIPIKFHAIKTSSGDGGMTAATRDALIDRLNSFYQNSDITFEHVGEVNEIEDDDNYNLDAAAEGAVAVGNDLSKTINVYFAGTIVSNGSALCGYTRFPPSSDRVFVAYGCINGGTFEHEIGHYFTLFHTHGTTNTGTTDELVDGSNCDVAGDRICDTPADPNLSGVVDGSCNYSGTSKDANGDFYSPDPRNIMSYAPGNCRTLFTSGQYDRIREGFENGRSYLNFTTESFSATISANTRENCVGGEITFNAISFGATSFEWTFEGGDPEFSSKQSPVVTYDEMGDFNVTLVTRNNSGDEATRVATNFITITDPLFNALKDDFSSTVDGTIPSELEVDNPDEGFTFEYSNFDANQDAASGSIFINNFDYFTENVGNEDILSLRNFETRGIKKIEINFDYAYTFRPGPAALVEGVYDSLQLEIKAQCGNDSEIIWKSGGEELSTAPESDVAFEPGTGEWSNKTLSYVVNEDDDYVGFDFRSRSFNGNNLYIDNLEFTLDLSVDDPIDFKLSKVENKVVTLRWLDGSNNEVNYVIERAVEGGVFETYASVDPNVIVFRDTLDIVANLKYRIYADGVNDNRSNYTQEVEVLAGQILSVEEETRINIYPNPTSNNLVVLGYTNEAFYYLTDLSGKELVKGELSGTSNTLDLSNLENGIYLFNVESNGKQEVRRIIKQ